ATPPGECTSSVECSNSSSDCVPCVFC
ncbi:hypothetical protein A2U01_0091577, partial [Trifolium medium]|nr:hypothetical protein [Trifolium medium]